MINKFLPQILIFLGLILTFIGGLISFYRSDKDTDKIIKLAEENKDLSNKLSSATNKLQNAITGGEGFCYLEFASLNKERFVALVCNDFDDVQYDIEVDFLNVLRIEECPKSPSPDPSIPAIDFKCYSKNVLSDHFDIVPSKNKVVTKNIFLLNGQINQMYIANFRTRNGAYMQKIYVEKVGNFICFANQIIRNGKVVKQFGDKQIDALKVPWERIGITKVAFLNL